MQHARVRSAVLIGVQAHVVDVEVDIGVGLPGLAIVGLPDTSVGEARERVRTAIRNAGFTWPDRRVTVALGPAGLPKRGAGLDLAIACAVLAAQGTLDPRALAGMLIVGELRLDGTVHAVPGALAMALCAREIGVGVIMPGRMAAEARLLPGLVVRHLDALVAAVRGGGAPDGGGGAAALLGPSGGGAAPAPGPATGASDHDRHPVTPLEPLPDLADVRGHDAARLALEVAAAGGHHLAMVGPPGVGKSLLAERMPGLLPPLTDAERVAVLAVHGAVDSPLRASVAAGRPTFIAPHHTVGRTAMVGGGSGMDVRVGLVTLAHRGVLFLDEAAEFPGSVLDALRQPLEAGRIVVHRTGFRATLPAEFQLLLASNPCPCGPPPGGQCACTPHARRRYLTRISGPILDRIDIRLTLRAPSRAELRGPAGEASATIATRIRVARERAAHRLAAGGWLLNARVPGAHLRHLPPPAGSHLLDDALDRGRLSPRGVDRVLRVAWTCADLNGRSRPDSDDVGLALALRDPHGAWTG
ncbi:MAG: ATP-binding protein [Actinomycetales bacterium]|nr:ATP-binding protein [Actinomycetales bacterium]